MKSEMKSQNHKIPGINKITMRNREGPGDLGTPPDGRLLPCNRKKKAKNKKSNYLLGFIVLVIFFYFNITVNNIKP